MRRLWIFTLIVLSVVPVFSQQTETLDPAQAFTPGVNFHGVLYPKGVNGEQFSDYYINARLSQELRLRLETFYMKFGNTSRIRSALLGKVHLSKKVYFLAGPEVEYDMNRTLKKDTYRLGMNLGLGYEVNENFLFEAKFNKQINNSLIGPFGEVGKADVFTLGSRFKF